MAAVKEYAYFLKGNKVYIVEIDTIFDNSVKSFAICSPYPLFKEVAIF